MTFLILFLLFCPEIRNVAFFFSAISAQGRKNSKGKKTTNNDGEDSDDNADEALTPSQAASSATQECISNHPTVINDKLRPFRSPAYANTARLGCGQRAGSSTRTGDQERASEKGI